MMVTLSRGKLEPQGWACGVGWGGVDSGHISIYIHVLVLDGSCLQFVVMNIFYILT